MKLLRVILLLLFGHGAGIAAVVITPDVPANGFQVLPGSTRQINVQITGGTGNLVNWSILSATGGASATLTSFSGNGAGNGTTGSSFSAVLPTVQINIGTTAGNCTITGTGPYTVVSTAVVTIQAQSVDDTSKTANFAINVCSKTTAAIVAPAYQQAFQGQHMTLQSWITGDTDETGTWDIEGQPAGGDGVLTDTTFRDADFHATVTGRYTLGFTSHSNGSVVGTAIVYVSPNAMPSYAVTPNGTEPRECYPDPALTGTIYPIGAGKTFTTIQSVPAANTIPAGSMLMVYNTDTTGSAPSTFHEFWQFSSAGQPTVPVKGTGTFGQPIIMCGVPDSTGHLPVMDGNGATGQSGVSGFAASGYGVITTWAGGYGSGSPYQPYQNGNAGPSYISITGLAVKNANTQYPYTGTGGNCAGGGTYPACTGYVNGAAAISLRTGSYIDISGNDLNGSAQGMASYDNSNSSLFGAITWGVTVTGNHFHNNGDGSSQGEHQAYFQSWFGLFQGNKVDQIETLSQANDLKWRGVELIARYNYLGPNSGHHIDLVDCQDASNYCTFEQYLAPGGPWSVGDTAGANVIAGFQESFSKDFVYGNLLDNTGNNSLANIHYGGDQSGGMNVRNGQLFAWNNTVNKAEIFIGNGVGSCGPSVCPNYYQPRFTYFNNIAYNTNAAGIAWNQLNPFIGIGTTNLQATNSGFSLTFPIAGCSYSGATGCGFGNNQDYSDPWPLVLPLNPHMYGVTSANYLTTGSTPYDSNFIPQSGSAAIGAGTAASGLMAQMPIRYQYSLITNTLTARTSPLTIGAEDPGSGTPTVVAPTFTPGAGTYSSTQTVTIATVTGGATICYTIDGSTPLAAPPGTCSHGTTYSSPVSVASNLTLNAIGTEVGSVNSATGTAAYVITGPPTVANPTCSPTTGTYGPAQTVTCSSSTGGSTTVCTINGSTPTHASPPCTSISVASTLTLKALSFEAGFTDSAVVSFFYIINGAAAGPTFTPPGTTYTSAQTVTLATATSGCTGSLVWNTTNAQSGGNLTGTSTTNPLTVSATETVYAQVQGCATWTNSPITNAAYTITPPSSSPAVFSGGVVLSGGTQVAH